MYTKDRNLYVINKTVPLDHPFCKNCVVEQQKLVGKEVEHKVWITNVIEINPDVEH